MNNFLLIYWCIIASHFKFCGQLVWGLEPKTLWRCMDLSSHQYYIWQATGSSKSSLTFWLPQNQLTKNDQLPKRAHSTQFDKVTFFHNKMWEPISVLEQPKRGVGMLVLFRGINYLYPLNEKTPLIGESLGGGREG